MCVKRQGMGNLCGGLFTILMLIIMFSVAHGRFQELIYISLAFIAITLTLCIICAICNTLCKGDPIIDYWTSNNNSYYNTRHHSSRYRHHHYNNNISNGINERRVHVCAPPRMGGARLNIIYTIGEENSQIPISTQSLDSMAINIDNNNYATRLSRTRSLSRSLSQSRSPSRRHCFQPIITIRPNSTSNIYPQVINAANNMPRIPIILPPNDDLPDLPPQYDQLDIVRPPSYQEAIQKQ